MDFKTRVLEEAHRQGFNLLNWEAVEQCLAYRPWGLRAKEKQDFRNFEFRWFKVWREGRDHPYTRREQRVDEERFMEEKEREENERRKKAAKLWKESDEQGDYDPEENEGKELRRTGRKRQKRKGSSSSSSSPSSSSSSAKRHFPPKLGRQISLEQGDDPEEIDSDNYELARGG